RRTPGIMVAGCALLVAGGWLIAGGLGVPLLPFWRVWPLGAEAGCAGVGSADTRRAAARRGRASDARRGACARVSAPQPPARAALRRGGRRSDAGHRR